MVSSSTVGNATKSLKFLMLIAEISTIIATAMLKVNNISSASGGSGTSIITNTINTRMGMPACAEGTGNLLNGMPKIAIVMDYILRSSRYLEQIYQNER